MQNFRTTPSGRKVKSAERGGGERERMMFNTATAMLDKGSLHTSLRPIFVLYVYSKITNV
jgi:hypothetical protein